MPLIDVTSLLYDPMVAGEYFQVARRTEIVNQYGESTVSYQFFDASGSIFPTGDNSLVREEAYQVQAKTIRVITTFDLQGMGSDAAGNSFQPDVVVWNGDNFLVKVINDYSSYGAGFVQADCASVDLADFPPA